MRRLALGLISICISCGVWAAKAPAQLPADVRVLVDVSGSMKKNDPKNLRIPAVRLIINLLPPGSRAGVWTFGKHVNMLIPVGKVDKSWQNKAGKLAGKIHAKGMFTDIGQVIDKATWYKKGESYQRSVILLTDGLVDISKDPTVNHRARERVLKEILPKLRKQKIKVHAIGLSGDADIAMLKEIALSTGGSYREAANADELQRVFLKVFDQAAKRDTLPLKGNKFKVDRSVEQITVLVFRKANAKPTELALPNKFKISKKTAPRNVKWHREKAYDLITIDRPPPGQWTIVGEMDPDNRVMVVSNLKMEASSLPNNIFLSEGFIYEVSLLEENKIITKPDFLKLVKVHFSQLSPNGNSKKTVPVDNGVDMDEQAGDGVFSTRVTFDKGLGYQEVHVESISPTFQRAHRQTILVHQSPITVKVENERRHDGLHLVTLMARTDLVDPGSLKIVTQLTSPDSKVKTFSLGRPRNVNEWLLKLEQLPPKAQYRLAFTITGSTLDGRRFKASSLPVIVKAHPPKFVPVTKPAPRPVVKPKAVARPKAVPKPIVRPRPVVKKPVAPAGPSFFEHYRDAILITGINFGLLIFTVLIFLVMRRMHKRWLEKLSQRL